MTSLRNTTTQFVNINAAYDKVFDYLTNPLRYKEWSHKFISDVFVEGTKTFAITPMGKTLFKVKGNRTTGNIDLFFGTGQQPIPTRLLRNGEGVTYLFTLFQPNGMTDFVWEQQGIPNLIEELQTLKTLLEQ